jgi:hypothetical protein
MKIPSFSETSQSACKITWFHNLEYHIRKIAAIENSLWFSLDSPVNTEFDALFQEVETPF